MRLSYGRCEGYSREDYLIIYNIMKKNLWIMVTSGGTDVAIDDVRCISNFSWWKTGSVIAEVALKAWHIVHYIHSKGSKVPFKQSLEVQDNYSDIDIELERLRTNMEIYKTLEQNLHKTVTPDFYSYQEEVLSQLQRPDINVAILGMAVSDYWPKKIDGKIRSDSDVLSIELEKLPKIISQIKTIRPDIFLVWFKLLTDDYSDQELIDIAYKSLQRDNQDMVVANKISPGLKSFSTYIITRDKEIIPVLKREDLAEMLIGTIENEYKN